MADDDEARTGGANRRRMVVRAVLIAIGVAVVFFAAETVRAGFAARDGRAHLEHAAKALRTQHVGTARADFRAAAADFRRAKGALDDTGPLLHVAHAVPLLRVQLRGIETMAHVGTQLAHAGRRLSDSADHLLTTQRAHRSLADSLPELRAVGSATTAARRIIERAARETDRLDGYRLIGPLGGNRDRLVRELRRAGARAVKADYGLRLLLWTIGADGPHRLLVFSQNPDEVRPTGGYMGTYGVMSGDGGHVRLLGYHAMGPWVAQHRNAIVPVAKAPTALRLAEPPQPQQFPNVNATPDWPSAVRLAMQLWRLGGEQPVDGAVSLMPQTLARIVGALGPVTVPRYGETVTKRNLVSRLEFHTHREAIRGEAASVRKQFIAVLAHAVVQKVLHAPSSKWPALGRAMAASFDAGEAMLWVSDPKQQEALHELAWDGAFPASLGDFYADAEFEYAAKNGHALKRTFAHTVTLRSDGSGVAETRMVLRNTAPYERSYNIDSLSYITVYGPRFASLDPASDEPDDGEPALAGHPAVGYLRAAQPLGSTSLKVVWRGQALALRRTDGSWLYRLEFRGQAGHTGDVLRLDVRLPHSWRWVGSGPPRTISLNGTYRGEWAIRHR